MSDSFSPDDPQRPRLHFAPRCWINDPIPFFHDGNFHVFLQHNPNAAIWGNMHWAHIVSRDLVHWQPLSIALAPDQSYDCNGVFTGCVIRHDEKFWAFYTGITAGSAQVQCVATSDDLTTWRKYSGNPIIQDQPPNFGACFRDPCVWREGNDWEMIVGSEKPDGSGGAALLYRSKDLLRWEYSRVLVEGDAAFSGHDFECPDFFPLDGKWVFLSSRGKTFWQVGDYDGQNFRVRTRGVCDEGNFYAAKTLMDDKGRRILFGWITESRLEEEQVAAGWNGVLSCPRVLSLDAAGNLTMQPAPEWSAAFSQLRTVVLTGDATVSIPLIQTRDLALNISSAKKFGLRIRNELANQTGDASPMWVGEAGCKTAQVFVDGSVIEIFAGERPCHTARFYPARNSNAKLEIYPIRKF